MAGASDEARAGVDVCCRRPREGCRDRRRLTGDDDLVEVVFGEEEAIVAVGGEELFDVAIGVDALDGVGLGLLHFNGGGVSEVIAAEGGVRAGGLGVEDGEDASAGIENVVEVLDERLHEALRDVVEGGPEEDDVELAAAEVEVLLEESGKVEAGSAAIFFRREGPGAGEGLVDEVGHVDAVAEAGEEVDVLRRGWTDVEDAEVGLGLKVLKQSLPSAGVTGNAWASEHGSAGTAGLVLVSAEEVAKHARVQIPHE